MNINGVEYTIEKNYRDAFDESEVLEKVTEYYEPYDYIFGDWAYGKLRLKGFFDCDNPKVSKINDIKDLEDYITNNCAYGCKYFLLKKKRKEEK